MEDLEQIKRELTSYLVITQQKLEALNKFYNPMIEEMNKGKLGEIILSPEYLSEYDKAFREWEEAQSKYRELWDKYLRLKS